MKAVLFLQCLREKKNNDALIWLASQTQQSVQRGVKKAGNPMELEESIITSHPSNTNGVGILL